MIRAKVDGRWLRHIPDYLLIRGGEPTFVVVKPLDRLDDPKVVETITWVQNRACLSAGCRCQWQRALDLGEIT